MKKYRVNTTISQKHHAILKEYAEKYGTQQSVLEHALESLKNNLDQTELSREEEIWMSLANASMACVVQKDFLKIIMESTRMEQIQEYAKREKPFESEIELYLERPLKECSLEKIMEALVINHRMCHVFDTVDYIDNIDHYMLKMTHSLGINTSRCTKIFCESLFTTYGVKSESTISEKTFFMKIFKK